MCLEKVSIDGRDFRVQYIHHRQFYTKEGQIRIAPKGGTTIATICKDGKNIVGMAKCLAFDVYNKKMGRIISGGKLLKKLGLNTKLALEK